MVQDTSTNTKKAKPAFQDSIQVTLEFVKDSYLEWEKDGQFHRGRFISAGELHTFEAKKRLQIKLGNAGGVRIRREGVKPRIAGPIAKIVILEYRRVPDPLDPGISRIKEGIKVIN